MNTLKEILTVFIFLAGVMLCITLYIKPFQWIVLILAMGCFLLASYIWPSKKKGQRDDENGFLDILEIFIELPIELISWLFRLLRSLFHKADVDLDILIRFFHL